MVIEQFIKISCNCGCKIKKIGGHYFRPVGLRNYSYPLNFKIPVNYKLVNILKWRYLITVILTHCVRKNAYEHVLVTNNYTLDKFDIRTRNRIKKSIHNCTFKKPDRKDMLNFGLEINEQALKMQQRKDKTLTDIKLWDKYLQSLYSHEDIKILGAYFENRMVGYLVVFELEGRHCINNAFIDRKDSETTNPMNGLLYTIVNQLIEENGSVNLSYGLETFDNPRPDLSGFKKRMLFTAVPVSRVYVINPIVLIFFKLIILYNIKLMKRTSIQDSFTKKIIRLYQGNRLLIREHKSNRIQQKFITK